MNQLLKPISQWQRQGKTGSIQFNFFKGGVSSKKFRESATSLNKDGGYFKLDGQFSLDVIKDRLYPWLDEKRVGNVTLYCSMGQVVGIIEERTTKDI